MTQKISHKLFGFPSQTIQSDSKQKVRGFYYVKQNSGKARPIAVKLLRYKDKELILAKARVHLKKTTISINEDFSDL